MDNSLHYTSTPGAQVATTFTGDAVAIYGTVSPDHADIQVTVDGQTTVMKGGSGGDATALHTRTLLYFGSNLGSSQHTLTMSPVQTANGQFMDLDAIMTISATGGGTDAGSSPSSTTATFSSSSSSIPVNSSKGDNSNSKNKTQKSKFAVSNTIIIATALSGAAALLIFLVVLFFLLRRRATKKRVAADVYDNQPGTPDLPIQRPGMMEAGFFSPITERGGGSIYRTDSRDSQSSFQSTSPLRGGGLGLPVGPPVQLTLPKPPPTSYNSARFGSGSETGGSNTANSGPPRRPMRPASEVSLGPA